MIPATRWRRAAAGTVIGADLVIVLTVVAALPGFVPYAVGTLALATFWGLMRPAGWGALALVAVQVLAAAVPRGAPTTLADWAYAALAASAVLATHLACALLASWPEGAGLPVETARRWVGQGAALAATAVTGAVLGAVGTLTPEAWGPWVLSVALVLAALVGATLWAGAGRRRA